MRQIDWFLLGLTLFIIAILQRSGILDIAAARLSSVYFKTPRKGKKKKKTLELDQDLAGISVQFSKNMMVRTHILLFVINILMVQLITKMVFSTICCCGNFRASAKLSPLSETVPTNEHNFGRLVYSNPRKVFVQVYIYIMDCSFVGSKRNGGLRGTVFFQFNLLLWCLKFMKRAFWVLEEPAEEV